MNSEQNSVGGTTRREFIKKSSLAVAAGATFLRTPVYGQNTAPSANVIGANNRIVVGYIGVGNQGTLHVNTQKEAAAANNIAQAAACDLSTTRVNAAAAVIGGDCKTYKDFEKLLERKDIDAVTIATCDHWHCGTAKAALQAGKHVYVEKPVSRYLPEAFDLSATVKSTGRVLQVGSQGCSAEAWHKAADLIQKNAIGKPIWAQGYYCRNTPSGEWNVPIPSCPTSDVAGKNWFDADDLDWKKWQRPVKDQFDFGDGKTAGQYGQSAGESYFRWRKYYRYCAGLLGDLVPHRLLPLMLATGNPEFPKRVTCIGTQSIHEDTQIPSDIKPERNAPEFVEVTAEFPSGLTMIIVACTVAERSPGFVIYGHKGYLDIGSLGERMDLKPEKAYSDDVDMQTFDSLAIVETIPNHEKNWFDSIRANVQPNANMELALKAQTVISLAEMSNRLNVMCCYDEASGKVTTAKGENLDIFTFGGQEPS